ncbi:MAG: type II secretion system protein J [Xanthobacteraceae bacterium]|jgi:general secretion pathway protein J
MRRQRRTRTAGFTLIEVLMATALMGAILAALATVTAQWLPNWNRGFARVQRSEQLGLGLERLVADLAAAEFVSPGRGTVTPLFDGAEQSVTLVRTAIGPNARGGLDILRIAEVGSDRGPALVRTRAPFFPVAEGSIPTNFAEPVVLVRAPFRVLFSYAGPDRAWKNTWRGAPLLPRAIRATVRDSTTGQTLATTTATLVHAEVPVECLTSEVMRDCLIQFGNPSAAPTPAAGAPTNRRGSRAL